MAGVLGDRATPSVADIDKKLNRLIHTLKLLRRNASELGNAADHDDTTSLIAEYAAWNGNMAHHNLNLVTTLAEDIRSVLHEIVPDLPLLPNDTREWSEAVAGGWQVDTIIVESKHDECMLLQRCVLKFV